MKTSSFIIILNIRGHGDDSGCFNSGPSFPENNTILNKHVEETKQASFLKDFKVIVVWKI